MIRLFFWIKGIFRITKPINIFYAAITQTFVYIKVVPEEQQNFISFAFVTLSMALVMAAGYLINAYYDVKIDMVNRPKKVIIGKYLSRRRVMIFHAIFSVLAVVLGFWVSSRIGILNIILLFLLWLYSNSLKRTPIWGNMLLAFLSTSILWSVCIYSSIFHIPVVVYSVFAFFIETIRHLLKDILDFKGDQLHGVNTLPIKIGILGTKRFIYLLSFLGYGISILYLIFVGNMALVYIFSLLGIMLIIFWYRLWWADRKKHFKVLINICKASIFLGVISLFIA